MRSAHRLPSLAPVVAALLLVLHAAPARAVEWMKWNEGMEAAKRTGRPVVVDVYTDWCGWCKVMDAEVYANPEVSSYLASHFVVIRLNAESGELTTYEGKSQSARTLASGFDISGYPTTLFFNSAGEHLVNVPGYLKRDRFMLLVRYIGDGHMARNVKWDDYVKQSQGK